MTTTIDAREADRALKAKHRAMWASGDYPALARDLIEELGQILVTACDVSPGDRVLDIAAGAGNVAVPAALAGADVVATDLTPELLAAGRAEADARGVALRWEAADAEALPYDDGEFDVVLSSVGVMFAPHHDASAAELLRVSRPGARIGLISWTPEGFIGQMFATMKPYLPAAPAGVQAPPRWGDADYVRALLGESVTDVKVSRASVRVDRFATPEEFRDYFKTHYGPTISAYRGLADHPERATALDAELADLAARHDVGGHSTVMDWEYLLFTARRA